MVRLSASLLVIAACLALQACKRAADAAKTVEPPSKAGQKSSAQAKDEDTRVQQAASNCRQRIQDAAREHAANAKRVQETKVLDMKEVTKREQVETKREVVRKFLASNEALRTLLVNEEAILAEELETLNVPQAGIKSAVKGFQSSIPGKAEAIRMRGADQRIGDSVLGALTSWMRPGGNGTITRNTNKCSSARRARSRNTPNSWKRSRPLPGNRMNFRSS